MMLHPFTKLFIFSIFISVLSCVTTPKVSDIAELNYDESTAAVTEKLGRGTSVLSINKEDAHFQIRVYETTHTENDYALLFVNGNLKSVSGNVKSYKYENCMELNESTNWEECFSSAINSVFGESMTMDQYDYTDDIAKEKKHEGQMVGDVVVLAAVAVPAVIVTWPFAVMCAGAEIMMHDSNGGISCYEKLREITSDLYELLPSNSDEFSIEEFKHFHSLYVMYKADKSAGDMHFMNRRWGCRRPGFDAADDVVASVGLRSGEVIWMYIKSEW